MKASTLVCIVLSYTTLRSPLTDTPYRTRLELFFYLYFTFQQSSVQIALTVLILSSQLIIISSQNLSRMDKENKKDDDMTPEERLAWLRERVRPTIP